MARQKLRVLDWEEQNTVESAGITCFCRSICKMRARVTMRVVDRTQGSLLWLKLELTGNFLSYTL